MRPLFTTTVHTQQSPSAKLLVNSIGFHYLAIMNSIGRPYSCVDWCFKNGIKIYPVPHKWKEVENEIEINDNGTIIRSGKMYHEKTIHEKIYELYCYYYDTRR